MFNTELPQRAKGKMQRHTRAQHAIFVMRSELFLSAEELHSRSPRQCNRLLFIGSAGATAYTTKARITKGFKDDIYVLVPLVISFVTF